MTSRQKLFQILQFRNEEVIAQTSESIKQTNADIHHSALVTNRLATASNEKNETIARLTEEARRESRSLKVLTFVAMLYLPATLMAVRRFPSLLNLPQFMVLLGKRLKLNVAATLGRQSSVPTL